MLRNYSLFFLGLLLLLCDLEIFSALSAASPTGQQSIAAQTIEKSPGVIKSESKPVTLDVVATDKKGRPITDLQQNDFHIFDEEQEQSIASFSRESAAHAAASNSQRHIILFFDDSNMNPDIEKRTRATAAKFAESSTSLDRLMAVVNFGGTLQVRQNFTANPNLVKTAVTESRLAAVSGGLPMGYQMGVVGASMVKYTEGDFDARGILLAMREVAKSVMAVPGRKSMVMFSPGFIVLPDSQAELTATIDLLNKANIAVYPIDVSGVSNSQSSADSDALKSPTGRLMPTATGPDVEGHDSSSLNYADNQLMLTVLAKGTGGFETLNANDFLKDLNKVKEETDEYYSLNYNPSGQVHDGSYHHVKIKVERRGVELRYRAGYYDFKSPDLLQGTPEGKVLEARLESPASGEIPISVLTPYFYPGPGVARVDLLLSVPGSSISFEKRKGEYHSEIPVLGIVYGTTGSVAARFSDTVKRDYDKKKMKDAAEMTWTYQNTFRIAPGMYTLKLALNSGGKFARYETPFYVQPLDGARLGLAGPALGEKYVPVMQLASNMETTVVEDRHRLIFNNMELLPSADYRFTKSSQPVVYVEVYDPALKTDHVSKVGVQFEIVDRKTHAKTFASDAMPIDNFVRAGNPLVPVAFKLPIAQLQTGSYRVDVLARDASGRTSSMRSADFSIE